MFSVSFLISKSTQIHKKCILFSVEKANPMFLTKCILHMCEVKSFPTRPFLKGESLLSRHKDPGYTMSYLWPCQLSAAFARASRCELCLVGTGGLCVVCSPANLLRVLQTSPPSPTGGGAAGECQAVASAIWAGPWPLINYPPLLSSSLSPNWE